MRIRVSERKSLDVVLMNSNGKFYIADREVRISNISHPINFTFATEPRKTSPRKLADLFITNYLEYADRIKIEEFNGLILWDIETTRFSKGIIQNNDFIKFKDSYELLVQFCQYKFSKPL